MVVTNKLDILRPQATNDVLVPWGEYEACTLLGVSWGRAGDGGVRYRWAIDDSYLV